MVVPMPASPAGNAGYGSAPRARAIAGRSAPAGPRSDQSTEGERSVGSGFTSTVTFPLARAR